MFLYEVHYPNGKGGLNSYLVRANDDAGARSEAHKLDTNVQIFSVTKLEKPQQ